MRGIKNGTTIFIACAFFAATPAVAAGPLVASAVAMNTKPAASSAVQNAVLTTAPTAAQKTALPTDNMPVLGTEPIATAGPTPLSPLATGYAPAEPAQIAAGQVATAR